MLRMSVIVICMNNGHDHMTKYDIDVPIIIISSPII